MQARLGIIIFALGGGNVLPFEPFSDLGSRKLDFEKSSTEFSKCVRMGPKRFKGKEKKLRSPILNARLKIWGQLHLSIITGRFS